MKVKFKDVLRECKRRGIRFSNDVQAMEMRSVLKYLRNAAMQASMHQYNLRELKGKRLLKDVPFADSIPVKDSIKREIDKYEKTLIKLEQQISTLYKNIENEERKVENQAIRKGVSLWGIN